MGFCIRGSTLVIVDGGRDAARADLPWTVVGSVRGDVLSWVLRPFPSLLGA